MIGTGSRIRIGEIDGHQIALDPISTAIIALIVFSQGDPQWGAAVLVAVFLSILVHELGHAFAIRRLTGQDTVIVVGGFGGVTLSGGTRHSGKQLLISLAGPGLGFVLGAIGWLASLFLAEGRYGPLPWQFYAGGSVWLLCLHYVVWASFLWGAVNLLPAYPLDGGQALRALLVVRGMRALRAERITRRMGMAISAAACAWALTEKLPILAFLCAWIFLVNFQEAKRDGF